MNKTAYEIIARRRRQEDMRSDYGRYMGEDYARGVRRYRDFDMANRRYAQDMYDGDDYSDYAQGVKGTGRYGIGGSRYYPRRDRNMSDMRYDRRDYNDYRDYRDYADEDMRLTESDMMEWKKKLQNADGTRGEHFDKNEIMAIAERMNIRYDFFNEKELCLVANMLYSDYCTVLKNFVPVDKEAYVYVAMAKAFLEDPDSPTKGSEKLSAYYNCIIADD